MVINYLKLDDAATHKKPVKTLDYRNSSSKNSNADSKIEIIRMDKNLYTITI